jgi:hypothetical protein
MSKHQSKARSSALRSISSKIMRSKSLKKLKIMMTVATYNSSLGEHRNHISWRSILFISYRIQYLHRFLSGVLKRLVAIATLMWLCAMGKFIAGAATSSLDWDFQLYPLNCLK